MRVMMSSTKILFADIELYDYSKPFIYCTFLVTSDTVFMLSVGWLSFLGSSSSAFVTSGFFLHSVTLHGIFQPSLHKGGALPPSCHFIVNGSSVNQKMS